MKSYKILLLLIVRSLTAVSQADNIPFKKLIWCALFFYLCCPCVHAKQVHHYVFFGRDRERITDLSFLNTEALEGAQVTYTWRQLEPEKDKYDFTAIDEDLAFLTSKGKKLFIQLQDLSFSESRINVPLYLLQERQYNGGAGKQYSYEDGHEDQALVAGWVARRWDPAVQERFHRLLLSLGKKFDGIIEGINLTETAVDFGDSGMLFPEGFSCEKYRDGIIINMKFLKLAFPESVVMQYANFMPGEWLPDNDKEYLKSIYKAAEEFKVGVGGPDLLPYKTGQLNHSYPLIRDAAGIIPTGIAVQDGNYEAKDPVTGMVITIPQLLNFATEYLKVDYIFWCIQEPFYSRQVIPFFNEGNDSRLFRQIFKINLIVLTGTDLIT